MKFKILKGGSAGGRNLGSGKRQMRTGGRPSTVLSSARKRSQYGDCDYDKVPTPWGCLPVEEASRECYCDDMMYDPCACSTGCSNTASPCGSYSGCPYGQGPCMSGGGGGWCFIAGTKVMMSDGVEKNIEEIEAGDVVKSWNEETDEIQNSKVMKLIQPIHRDMLIIKFNNDVVNENTFDHPYYVKGKGWCSHKPELTMERYNIGQIEQLKLEDICYHNNGGELEEIEVISIEENWGEVQTYIFELDNNNTFFANAILVHNKGEGSGEGKVEWDPEEPPVAEPGCVGPRCVD
jgi:hypothetical protein